jgi:hypothetical protein
MMQAAAHQQQQQQVVGRLQIHEEYMKFYARPSMDEQQQHLYHGGSSNPSESFASMSYSAHNGSFASHDARQTSIHRRVHPKTRTGDWLDPFEVPTRPSGHKMRELEWDTNSNVNCATIPLFSGGSSNKLQHVTAHPQREQWNATPNMNCVTIPLFSGGSKPYASTQQPRPQKTKKNFLPMISCTHLGTVNEEGDYNVSSASSKSFLGKPNRFSNPMQIFHCNGVRGVGQRFDYSEKKTSKSGSHRRSSGRKKKNEHLPPPMDEISIHDSFDDQTFVLDSDVFYDSQMYEEFPKNGKKNKTKKYSSNTSNKREEIQKKPRETRMNSSMEEKKYSLPLSQKKTSTLVSSMPYKKYSEPLSPKKVSTVLPSSTPSLKKKLGYPIPVPSSDFSTMTPPDFDAHRLEDTSSSDEVVMTPSSDTETESEASIASSEIESQSDGQLRLEETIRIVHSESDGYYSIDNENSESDDSSVIQVDSKKEVSLAGTEGVRDDSHSRESEDEVYELDLHETETDQVRLVNAITSRVCLVQPKVSDSPVPCKKNTQSNLDVVLDHAALAQSIREICLRELDEFPSFDEPQARESDKTPTLEFDNESSSDSSSSGGENKPLAANDTIVVRGGEDLLKAKQRQKKDLPRHVNDAIKITAMLDP